MFAPGFVTGSLIRRFGMLHIILAGVALTAVATFVALDGNSVAHFVAALVLVGVGWNFMYTGGTIAADGDLRADREGAHAGR